jgi:hypothetical protein
MAHFLQIDPKAKAPDQNVPTGTVLDQYIVHPHYTEFYLNSHRAPQVIYSQDLAIGKEENWGLVLNRVARCPKPPRSTFLNFKIYICIFHICKLLKIMVSNSKI